jgi:hypothetical protein
MTCITHRSKGFAVEPEKTQSVLRWQSLCRSGLVLVSSSNASQRVRPAIPPDRTSEPGWLGSLNHLSRIPISAGIRVWVFSSGVLRHVLGDIVCRRSVAFSLDWVQPIPGGGNHRAIERGSDHTRPKASDPIRPYRAEGFGGDLWKLVW